DGIRPHLLLPRERAGGIAELLWRANVPGRLGVGWRGRIPDLHQDVPSVGLVLCEELTPRGVDPQVVPGADGVFAARWRERRGRTRPSRSGLCGCRAWTDQQGCSEGKLEKWIH